MFSKIKLNNINLPERIVTPIVLDDHRGEKTGKNGKRKAVRGPTE